MTVRGYLIIFTLLGAINGVSADEASRMVYQNDPIKVQLKVGSERRIVLTSEQELKVGVPRALADKLTVTAIGSQVWLLANQAFADEKIILQTPSTKMVLELSAAVDYAAGETIVLSSKPDISLSEAQTTGPGICDVGIVELVRYALQWAYAPRRLLNVNPCISAINYPQKLIGIMNCLRTNEPICGGGVVAKPIAAWRTTEHYASLLELKNTLQTSVALDPRAVVGDFKAAAFAHHKLEAVGTPRSVTALVVVGDKPLNRSISPQQWLDKKLIADYSVSLGQGDEN